MWKFAILFNPSSLDNKIRPRLERVAANRTHPANCFSKFQSPRLPTNGEIEEDKGLLNHAIRISDTEKSSRELE